MQYEWDENKRKLNVEKHGEDFADVSRLDWSRAHIEPDTRYAYGETRYVAFVPRDDDRLMCLVFAPPWTQNAHHQLQKSQRPGEKKT